MTRAPTPALLWTIAIAGAAAAAGSIAIALTSERVADPGIQIGLLDWIVLTYTVGGAVAWWRRPDSRFGPADGRGRLRHLRVVAVVRRRRAALHDRQRVRPRPRGALPARLPRLPDRPPRRAELERALVGATYAVVIGLQVVKLMLGGFGAGQPAGDRPTSPTPRLRRAGAAALDQRPVLAGVGLS